MFKKVWVFQDSKDVKRRGVEKASYYVGWYDLDGKRHSESCGPGTRGKTTAERRKRQLQSELDMGQHQPQKKKTWIDFRKEYEDKILSNFPRQSQIQVQATLNHFERMFKPNKMDAIKTQMIDAFIAARKNERGKNPGSKISPATINKDLRHIKAALNHAVDWEYLTKVPKIKMVRQPEKLVRYVTPEHFSMLYHDACKLARLPVIPLQPFEPCVWWKSLMATCYMTGWRIRELLAMRRVDVNLDTNTVITRHSDNKGNRDELVPVHPIVIEHLRAVITDHEFVFRWPHGDTKLWLEFGRIQRLIGIQLPCREKHDHTPSCHVYGFHDFRRAFATVNGKGMKPETLQKMMRHKSYKTTLGYINLSEQIEEAVKQIPIPDALKKNGQHLREPRQHDGEGNG